MKKRVVSAVQMLKRTKLFITLIFCILTYNYNYCQSEFVVTKLDSLNRVDSLKLNINSKMIVVNLNRSKSPISANIYNIILKDIQFKVSFEFKENKYIEYFMKPNHELINKYESSNPYDLLFFKKVKDINEYFNFFKSLGFDKEYNVKELHTNNLKSMIVKENSNEIFKVNFVLSDNKLKTVKIFEEGNLEKQYYFNTEGFLIKRINKFYKKDLLTYYFYRQKKID